MTVTGSTKARHRHKSAHPAYEGNTFAYGLIKPAFALLIHLIYRCKAEGMENIPATGPTIVVLNHLHIFDPGVVMPLISRRIVTLAAVKWETHPIFGRLLRWAGSIFVRRGEVDRVALRSCLEVLEGGGLLAIAPEGTRSNTGALQRAKPGIAYLAIRTNATLVPLAHWGVERLADWKRLKRPTCHAVIGRPFKLPAPEGKVTSDELQELTDLVMIEHGRLLPPSYRGFYAERIAAVEAGHDTGPSVIPV